MASRPYVSARNGVSLSNLLRVIVTRYAVTRYMGGFYGIACCTNEGHA
jgi:hypothetical protein